METEQHFDREMTRRQALGGPIMIAKMAGKEAKQGFADVAGFTVMLSLELGIINLLPVPLLDGGHLFFAQHASAGKDMNALLKRVLEKIGGKGGGTGDFARGKLSDPAKAQQALDAAVSFL